MNAEDFWKAYVGEKSPGQFMYDYGARDPEICVARHVATLPALYGIMRRQSWEESFTGEEHSREQVTAHLLAHLEDTRAFWQEAVSQMPERPWPPAPGVPQNTESEEHRHPQRIDTPEEQHVDGTRHLQRDRGGLPREHTGKEVVKSHARRLIGAELDQKLSIEQSMEKTQPIYHTPEPELPLGTEVDQDMPNEHRLVRVETELELLRGTEAEEDENGAPANAEVAGEDTADVAGEELELELEEEPVEEELAELEDEAFEPSSYESSDDDLVEGSASAPEARDDAAGQIVDDAEER